RQRIRYTARQHAFWSSGATGVRHVFYRLFSISLGDREDAATNVCRRPAWRLRPAARFLDPAHRHNILRAISSDAAKTCSGGAGEAYRSYSLTRYPASLEIGGTASTSRAGRARPSGPLGILRPDRQRTVSAAPHRKMPAFENTILNSFSIHRHGIPALTQASSTSTKFSCESGGVVRLPGAQAQRTSGSVFMCSMTCSPVRRPPLRAGSLICSQICSLLRPSHSMDKG